MSTKRLALNSVARPTLRRVSRAHAVRHYGQPKTTAAVFSRGKSCQYRHVSTATAARTKYSNVPESVKEKIGRNLHLQPKHPINIIKSHIENYFQQNLPAQSPASGLPTGKFQAFDNMNPRVSTMNNFDKLLVAPDHVSRQPSDTFYFDEHTVLRTHTSAHQCELITQGSHAFLATGDCYRRDEIDASHYPVFHQMEGVRVFSPDELRSAGAKSHEDAVKLVTADLQNVLEGLARLLFGPEAQSRWVDAYFPFTHPSFEMEVLFQQKWLECLGCGVVQPKILHSCDLSPDHVGWAFGLGIERLAMVLFGIPDIRLFWSTDARFLDQFASGSVDTRFQPFSKYPPVFKDITFWLPQASGDEAPFHVNDFFEAVRGVAGDMVEQVECIDTFTHPKTGRTSQCFRITYRSMDRTLTNQEIDQLQEELRHRLSTPDDTHTSLHVELR